MKHFAWSSLIALLLAGFWSCSKGPQTSNLIEISPEDGIGDIIRKSTLVVPTRNQYEWQKLEYIAFIHFGPNTFTAVEWGNGMEDPAVFNPTELDVNQWISVIKQAQMKLAMITAKHHDGFCLWPTTTSRHSVASSPWKDGKGDLLAELTAAAAKEGIRIGIYLSPADLHEIEREGGTYGNGSEPRLVKIPSDPALQQTAKKVFEYELDDYNALFMNQLYEVLSQYGPVHEVWFDGANPKPGTGQTYRHDLWYAMIRELQPEAVIAIKGPDVRWCGNEAGYTRPDEWSVLPTPVHPDEYSWPDKMDLDLGSREKLEGAKYLYWYPAETNTSIRSGWFYRDDQQYVKTVDQLVDNWYRSVGGNSVFLLNLTPDRRGLIPEPDASRLIETGRIISESFRTNLANGAVIRASDTRRGHPATAMTDGNPKTFWKPADGNESPEFIIELPAMTEFNRLVLMEDILTSGQRIEAFAVDIFEDGAWKQIAEGTTVGYKNIRRFPMVTADQVRVRILASRISPTIAEAGIYKAPEMLSNPRIRRDKEGTVTITTQTPDPEIRYTLDGTEPDIHSPLFVKPFALPAGGTVKAIAVVDGGRKQSETIEARYDISSSKWSVVSPGNAHQGFGEERAIDGQASTFWHTPWSGNTGNHPHSLTVDLGETLELKGFSYLPRSDGNLSGVCERYRFEISSDGITWRKVSEGSFGNIRNNPVLQEIFFRQESARFIRFTSLSSVNNDPYLSVAEIGVITR